MAYSALPAKSASDTLTLGNYNAIKGNFEAGVPDIFTTKGDIAAATANDTAARLAVGSDNSIIVADSGESTGLAYQIIPACRVYNSGDIDPATSSWVKLTFDSERTDVEAMHSGGSPGRITVPTDGAGLYMIGGMVTFDTSSISSGYAQLGLNILLNNTTDIAQVYMSFPMLSQDNTLSISALYRLDDADYVELQVYTSQDVDVLAVGNTSPVFWAVWQRRLGV